MSGKKKMNNNKELLNEVSYRRFHSALKNELYDSRMKYFRMESQGIKTKLCTVYLKIRVSNEHSFGFNWFELGF